MPSKFVETHQIVPIVMPLDWDTDRTGDYVSLQGFGKLVVIAVASPGTAGDDPTFTFQQATDVAATGAKDLTVITESWSKQAATDLTAVGTFTRAAQSAATTLAGNATSAEQAKVYVIEINAEQLDVDGGFDCVQVNVALAASGGAQYGTIIGILCDPRFPQATTESAIVD